jgi:hypothetical protein
MTTKISGRVLGHTRWFVVMVLLVAILHPESALAQAASGGESSGNGCIVGLCDPGAWLRNIIPQVIADFLNGLIAGFGNLVTSLINDVNFITRTPEALTYRNDMVRQFAVASQVLANALLVVVTLVAGFNVMLRPHLGSHYAGVLGFVPRLLLGGILINTAAVWCQLAIDVNNAVCGVFGAGPPTGLIDQLLHLSLPFELLIGLIYTVMTLLLVVQQLMRLALIDVLLILAPLAAACWILPQTQTWGRRWGALFAATVFAQMVLTLTLRLGFNLTTDLAPLSAAGLLQPLLGIAVLALALKIPGLMGGGAGGGTIVTSLLGTAAGATAGVGARLAIGVGSRVASRGSRT